MALVRPMSKEIAVPFVRVYAHAGVGRLRSQAWNDVRSDHPQLDDWLAAGLVTYLGPRGEAPPTGLLRRPCCGQR